MLRATPQPRWRPDSADADGAGERLVDVTAAHDWHWPEQFDALRRGEGCPMCASLGATESVHGVRVFEGRWSEANLSRRPMRPGYTVVVWKGRHVAEPWELSGEEAAGFWSEVAQVARAFVHLISRPEAMRACVELGMRSEFLMNQLLRIMANLMRPDVSGAAEIGYRAMELVSRLLPDSGGLEEPAA